VEHPSLADQRNLTPLAALVRPVSVRAGEDEYEVLSVTKHQGIVRADDYFNRRVASRNLAKYKVVQPGHFAYSTIHIDEGAIARNKLGVAGVVSPMYQVFEAQRPDLVLPEFLDYLLRAPALLAVYRSRAGGSVRRRRSLPFETFGRIEVGLPSLPEQHRILDVIADLEAVAARHIDAQDSIDRLLAAERTRLIDESGAPQVRLDELLDGILGGRSPVCAERVPTPEEWGVLKISAVQPFGFDRGESKLLPPGVEPFAEARVNAGDVLITRSNTPDKVGMACFVDEDPGHLLLSDLTWRLQPSDGAMRPDYLAEALMTPRARAAIRAMAAGTSGSMKKINRTKIRRLSVSCPDPDDQQRIAGHLADVRAVCRAEKVAARTFRDTRLALINNLASGRTSIAEARGDAADDPGSPE
jgi:type I restriction enzyme, S subunit